MHMVAVKRVKYPHGNAGKEYQPGEPFEALSERDAKGLYIAGKAKYGKAANKTDLPKPAVTVKEVEAEPAPLSRSYLRRDMTAEPAGLTGQDNPSPSSRRGRPPRNTTYPSFGEDGE
jgi:hypothetical protein